MLSELTQVIQKSHCIIGDTEKVEQIKLPALREVLGYVTASKNSEFAYTKHSAHTKTSTKGCPLGCLAG
jgi:hypothetical protein